MRSIWKFQIELRDQLQAVTMPNGAKVLTVQLQGSTLALWAEVETDAPRTKRYFRVFGTGHEMPRDMGYSDVYIGTVQDPPFVWHVYEQIG